MNITEQLSRRFAFGEAARDYDAVRPGYPSRLVQTVMRRAALGRESTVLEIGCGTGQATTAFAETGCTMLCLEPAPELAKLAAHNLSRFPRVRVSTETFEHIDLEPASFDLVLAATSFHWLDPLSRWEKAAHVLRPAGTIAILTNVHPLPLIGFFARVQDIYRSVAPALAHAGDKSATERWAEELHAELAQSPYFEEVEFRCERWEKQFAREEYVALLNTFSPHRQLEEETRNQLFAAIEHLIDIEYGGYVEQPYLTTLRLARKRGQTRSNHRLQLDRGPRAVLNECETRRSGRGG